MTQSEFTERADAALARIEAAPEAAGADVDVELTDGGVLELEFAYGSKVVVNRHAPAQEIGGKVGRLPTFAVTPE